MRRADHTSHAIVGMDGFPARPALSYTGAGADKAVFEALPEQFGGQAVPTRPEIV